MHKVVVCTLVGMQLHCRCKGEVCPIFCAHGAPGGMALSDVGKFRVHPPAVIVTGAGATPFSVHSVASSRRGQ